MNASADSRGEASRQQGETMKLVIKDSMTGRYYCGGNPNLPRMGGSLSEATRFRDRMAAAEVLRQFPMTVLAEVEEVKDG
jgi:hypothetical protein